VATVAGEIIISICRTAGRSIAEKLWYPHFDGQAAYIVPPCGNLSDGPSGVVYDPGVSDLPEKYRGCFFLADFRGMASTSGIRPCASSRWAPALKWSTIKSFCGRCWRPTCNLLPMAD